MLPEDAVRPVLSQEEYKAIEALQDHLGMRAVIKFCESEMKRIETMIFGTAPLAVEQSYQMLSREHLGYRMVRDLILNPMVYEEESEETE